MSEEESIPVTPLGEACIYGNLNDVIRLLLHNDVNYRQGPDLSTPLTLAARFGHPRIVEYLVNKSHRDRYNEAADPNVLDSRRYQAIDQAYSDRALGFVDGVDPHLQCYGLLRPFSERPPDQVEYSSSSESEEFCELEKSSGSLESVGGLGNGGTTINSGGQANDGMVNDEGGGEGFYGEHA